MFLDHQPINRNLVFKFLRDLHNQFGVSFEVAKYKLMELELLKEESDTSIRRIIRS